MAKKNSEYWKERMQALEEEQYQRSARYYKDLQEQYDRARRDMEKDIAVWYQRLADNNGISYAEAKKLLEKNELKEFQWSVKQYIKAGEENAVDRRWMKELENASAKYHISRLEAMKMQLQHHIEQLSAETQSGMKEFLRCSYEEQYYHTAFEIAKGTEVGSSLMKLDTRRIDAIIRKPWAQDGQAFSDRIWVNKNKLVNNLHTELVQNIIRGTPPKQATDNLAKIMNVGRSQAGRLVMTESAAIASRAQQDCFKELEIEKYEIVATLDNKTSEICQEMDGKVFDRKDYQVGLTAPPFHPWCRSTTVPYFDDEFAKDEKRAARDEETGETYYVPSDMTYKEWKVQYIDSDIHERGISNKQTAKQLEYSIDRNLIESNEYKRKYNRITGKAKVDAAIHRYAKAGLIHRDGTAKEDLYILSATTGAILGKNTSSNELFGVMPNDSIRSAVKNNQGDLIGLHTHPDWTPPTGSDFETAFKRRYNMAVVAGADGSVYIYGCGEQYVTGRFIDDTIEKFKKMVDNTGKKIYDNDRDAHLAALEQLRKDYGIWYEAR